MLTTLPRDAPFMQEIQDDILRDDTSNTTSNTSDKPIPKRHSLPPPTTTILPMAPTTPSPNSKSPSSRQFLLTTSLLSTKKKSPRSFSSPQSRLLHHRKPSITRSPTKLHSRNVSSGSTVALLQCQYFQRRHNTGERMVGWWGEEDVDMNGENGEENRLIDEMMRLGPWRRGSALEDEDDDEEDDDEVVVEGSMEHLNVMSRISGMIPRVMLSPSPSIQQFHQGDNQSHSPTTTASFGLPSDSESPDRDQLLSSRTISRPASIKTNSTSTSSSASSSVYGTLPPTPLTKRTTNTYFDTFFNVIFGASFDHEHDDDMATDMNYQQSECLYPTNMGRESEPTPISPPINSSPTHPAKPSSPTPQTQRALLTATKPHGYMLPFLAGLLIFLVISFWTWTVVWALGWLGSVLWMSIWM